MNRLDQLKIVQNEAAQLFDKKNKDYGDAFAIMDQSELL